MGNQTKANENTTKTGTALFGRIYYQKLYSTSHDDWIRSQSCKKVSFPSSPCSTHCRLARTVRDRCHPSAPVSEADGQMASGQDLLRRPCADEEDPAIRHRAIPDDAAPPTSGEKTRPAWSKRVASLDIFRGLTVAVPSRPIHHSPLCCFGFLLWSPDVGGCWAVDDPGGRSRWRMAGDRTRAVEWVQPRRLRDALLPLHRWDGHPSFPQGCSHSVSLFLCSPLFVRIAAKPYLLSMVLAEDPEPGAGFEESDGSDAQTAVLGHHLARLGITWYRKPMLGKNTISLIFVSVECLMPEWVPCFTTFLFLGFPFSAYGRWYIHKFLPQYAAFIIHM